MKFKVDENLPVEVAELLRQAGYDAATVFDEKLAGETDRTIAAVCRLEQRAIVTLDVEISGRLNIVVRQHKDRRLFVHLIRVA